MKLYKKIVNPIKKETLHRSSKKIVSVIFFLLIFFISIVIVQSNHVLKSFAEIKSPITPTFSCFGLGACNGTPTLGADTIGQLCQTHGDCKYRLVCVNHRCQEKSTTVSPTNGSTGGIDKNPSNTVNISGSTCNDKYKNITNPSNKNFGDPKCDFDKNKLYALIKKNDPQNVDKWFNIIIPCESGFDPNKYQKCDSNNSSCGSYDPAGRWGLFGMGQGKNGTNDHGDVEWTQQTSNALKFNQILMKDQKDFQYWGSCAKGLAGNKKGPSNVTPPGAKGAK